MNISVSGAMTFVTNSDIVVLSCLTKGVTTMARKKVTLIAIAVLLVTMVVYISISLINLNQKKIIMVK